MVEISGIERLQHAVSGRILRETLLRSCRGRQKPARRCSGRAEAEPGSSILLILIVALISIVLLILVVLLALVVALILIVLLALVVALGLIVALILVVLLILVAHFFTSRLCTWIVSLVCGKLYGVNYMKTPEGS